MLWKDLVITGVLNAHVDMKASTVKGRINEKGRKRKGGKHMKGSNVPQCYKCMFTNI